MTRPCTRDFLPVVSISLQAVTWANDLWPRDAESSFCFFLWLSVWQRKKEGGKEAMRSLPTQVFCCFSFHLSGISLCSCGTRWSLLLIHSLSFSVAHSQEKTHLCPIKTSLSPSKLIACVSICVQVISRGWTEFRFAARQKENKY